MKHALLIARHEFIETIRRPAFYLSILIFFVSGILGATIPRLIEDSLNKPIQISIVDLAGNTAEDLITALEREDKIEMMAEVNAAMRDQLRPEYQEEGTPGPSAVPAIYAKYSRDITTKDVEKFEQAGGLKAYVDRAKAYVSPNAILALPKQTDTLIINATQTYQSMTGPTRERVVNILSKTRGDVTADKHFLLLVPEKFTPERALENPIALWSQKAVDPDFAFGMRASIEDFAAEKAARDRGELQAVEHYIAQTAALRYHALDKAEEDSGSTDVDIASFLVKRMPIGLLFIVSVIVLTQSVILLSNTMEEKSNRIVEVMLSSVSSNQFMLGKLLGPLFIFGFLVLLVFIIGTGFISGLSFFVETPEAAQIPAEAQLAAAEAQTGKFEEIVKPLIAGLLPKLPAALLYTVLAYLTFAGFFLATGAYCTDMRQVQTMATPLNLLLMSVEGVAIVAAFNPDGTLAKVLTWLPPTSPFVMVGRLGTDIAWWEYAGTILMQCATIYLVLRLAGRLFRHAALKGEGLPSLKQLGQVIMGKTA